MPSPQEFATKLWQALKSDRTVMLGLAGHGGGSADEDGHTRPMTAQIDDGAPDGPTHDGPILDGQGPIWFFTSIDNLMVAKLRDGAQPATAAFASKGHDLFACIHGDLRIDTDRAVVDRLWNSHIAAWYEGGKTDPKLVLLRFDPDHAEVWEDASSIVAGIKTALGIGDPKQDYRDKKASIALG